MTDKEKDQPLDEKRFNETLKRMLKTPPKPHDKAAKDKPKDKSADKPKQKEGDKRST